LLVDADLRFPSLQRLFGVRQSLGLVSYLTGQQDWRSAVCPSRSPGLDLLLCGPVPPNPAELLSSKSMGAFLTSAKAEYGFVILDSSPLLSLADSRILAALVDGVLLVVKSGATPRDQVTQSQSSIRSSGANLIVVVLNNVTLHTTAWPTSICTFQRTRWFSRLSSPWHGRASTKPRIQKACGAPKALLTHKLRACVADRRSSANTVRRKRCLLEVADRRAKTQKVEAGKKKSG